MVGVEVGGQKRELRQMERVREAERGAGRESGAGLRLVRSHLTALGKGPRLVHRPSPLVPPLEDASTSSVQIRS